MRFQNADIVSNPKSKRSVRCPTQEAPWPEDPPAGSTATAVLIFALSMAVSPIGDHAAQDLVHGYEAVERASADCRGGFTWQPVVFPIAVIYKRRIARPSARAGRASRHLFRAHDVSRDPRKRRPRRALLHDSSATAGNDERHDQQGAHPSTSRRWPANQLEAGLFPRGRPPCDRSPIVPGQTSTTSGKAVQEETAAGPRQPAVRGAPTKRSTSSRFGQPGLPSTRVIGSMEDLNGGIDPGRGPPFFPDLLTRPNNAIICPSAGDVDDGRGPRRSRRKYFESIPAQPGAARRVRHHRGRRQGERNAASRWRIRWHGLPRLDVS